MLEAYSLILNDFNDLSGAGLISARTIKHDLQIRSGVVYCVMVLVVLDIHARRYAYQFFNVCNF